jgi:hypothetical protein
MAQCRAAALQQAFGSELVLDRTITIALYKAVGARALATLQIDIEVDYMPYLRESRCPPDRRSA